MVTDETSSILQIHCFQIVSKQSGALPAVSSSPGNANLSSLGSPVGTSALPFGSSLSAPDPLYPLQSQVHIGPISALSSFPLVISPLYPWSPLEICIFHFHPLLSVSSEMTKMTTSKVDNTGLCWSTAGDGLAQATWLFPCKVALTEYDAGDTLCSKTLVLNSWYTTATTTWVNKWMEMTHLTQQQRRSMP